MLRLIQEWRVRYGRERDYRTKTFYAISFLMMSYSLAYVLAYLVIIKSELGMAINFAAFVSYTFSVFIIANRRVQIAKILQLCTLVLQLLAVSFVFSTQAGFHFYFILLPVVAFLFFEFDQFLEKATIVIFTIISIFSFIGCEIYAVEIHSPGIPTQILKMLFFSAITLIIVALFIGLRIFSIAFKKAERELILLSTTDMLTGAYNRRYFEQHAEMELARSHRYNDPLAFLMLDIDYFKNINDSYGHDIGDEALKAVVLSCQKVIRNTDFFSRIGGEKFAALLVNINKKNAALVANRFRQAIEELLIPSKIEDIQLTISVGIAFYNKSGETLSDLMSRADAQLYRAKDNGRNRVEFDVKAYNGNEAGHSSTIQ